jgi:hypothetical protein
VWGNHSPTMYADYRFATIDGAVGQGHDQRPGMERDTFLPTVGKRGAAIIEARGLSSAASAANAAIDHMRDWVLGTNGKWTTMGIPSDGSYGIPEGTMFGFPVTTENGEYKIVQGLEIDEFSQERINLTLKRTDRRARRRQAPAGLSIEAHGGPIHGPPLLPHPTRNTDTMHPSEVLFQGKRQPLLLPACDHYAGSEKLMRKSMALQQELGPVFDITFDCEDGAAAGNEAAHARLVGALINSEGQPLQPHRRARARRRQRLLRADVEAIVGARRRKLAYLVLPKAGSLADVRAPST